MRGAFGSPTGPPAGPPTSSPTGSARGPACGSAGGSPVGSFEAAELRLHLVSGFTVYRHGAIWPATGVGSRKARHLLALLASEPGRLIGLDRIIEVLWPGPPPRLPADNVATMVSRLRTTLGPRAITGGRGGYRLGPAVRVDLDHGAGLVEYAGQLLAAGEPAAALVPARKAVALLDGDLLADLPDATWVVTVRAAHAGLLRRARHAAAGAAVQVRDPMAGPTAEAAVRADPLDEAACRILMRAYAADAEPARAIAAYQRLRAILADELGVDPAPQTRDLYVAILLHRVSG